PTRKMWASNSKSASPRQKKNASPGNQSPKLISQGKCRSGNVQNAAERFLRLKRATCASARRLIESPANSSLVKRFSARTSQKSRRRSYSQRGKRISSTASSRKEDARSLLT